MTWEGFYLICFLVGFCLSLVSVLGTAHTHFHGGQGHFGGHGHLGGHGHGHGVAHVDGATGKPSASPFNVATLSAFLAWFGGTGYLLVRYSNVWILLALGVATLSGLGGAAVVFWFLFKVLLQHERDLDPADYEMPGVLGRVNSTIRSDGVGEIIFSQAGERRAAAAKSDGGGAIQKGTEVIVTRYEKGIAYVRPWDEMAGVGGEHEDYRPTKQGA